MIPSTQMGYIKRTGHFVLFLSNLVGSAYAPHPSLGESNAPLYLLGGGLIYYEYVSSSLTLFTLI